MNKMKKSCLLSVPRFLPLKTGKNSTRKDGQFYPKGWSVLWVEMANASAWDDERYP